MYSIVIGRRAQKSIAGLPGDAGARVRAAILALGVEPRPPGCRKLTGRDEWRLRVGDFRVLYLINDPSRLVTVLAVGHRRDIYA